MNAIVFYLVRAVTCTRRIFETLVPLPSFSLAFIRTARRHHLVLYTSLSLSFLSLFFFRENGIWQRSRKSSDRIYFSASKNWEFTARERAWTIHENVTRINIYSSARSSGADLEWVLGENGMRYRSHTAGETTCPRSSIHGASGMNHPENVDGFYLIPWIRV